MQVPEGDTGDDVVILAEEAEEAGILLGLAGEDLRRAAVGVRVDLRHLGTVPVAVGPPATARNDVDVELADHDLHADGAEGDQGLLQRLIGHAVDLIVALETDGMHRRLPGLQPGQQREHLLPLAVEFVVIVVVDQLRRRIRRMGVFEGQRDEVLARGARPAGLAQLGLAVVKRLVDHIPRRDLALVTADDRFDVRLHAGQQDLFRGRGRPILIEPGRRTVVLGPDQAMADDLEVLGIREGDEVVGLSEIPGLLRPAERVGLHAVLRRHMAELSRQQRPVRRAIGNPVGETDA